MSYIDFSEKIKTEMGKISAIQAIYKYEPENPEGFPFCSIIPDADGGKDERLDSCSNETTYQFKISVMDDLGSEDSQRDVVELRILGIADSVIDLFQKKDIFGSVGGLFHIAENNGFKYIQREGGYVRVFETIVTIRKQNTLI